MISTLIPLAVRDSDELPSDPEGTVRFSGQNVVQINKANFRCRVEFCRVQLLLFNTLHAWSICTAADESFSKQKWKNIVREVAPKPQQKCCKRRDRTRHGSKREERADRHSPLDHRRRRWDESERETQAFHSSQQLASFSTQWRQPLFK